DRAFHADEIEASDFEACAPGSSIIELPAYIAPIVVVFVLDGITSLDLDADTIARIFAGDITTWNNPAIAEQNPGVTLPETRVTPVHRSDESGTTENFTEYLAEAAPDAWPYEPDGVWPFNGGEAAQGTS